MPLFKVSIERIIMVIADNETEALQIAGENEREEFFNDPEDVWADEVKSINQIPEPWQDSLPYGGDDDKKCREYVGA